MNGKFETTLKAALAALLLPAAGFAGEKIIYGDDNRLDYFEAPAARTALADSVVSLWAMEDVEASGAGFKLKTKRFTDAVKEGAGVPLCPGEPFREQPTGSFCSGSLIGEDLVMTAGHCVTTPADCVNVRLVFDFAVRSRGGSASSEVPASSVYSCSKIEVSRLQSTETTGNPVIDEMLGLVADRDYAVIRLDRKVTGRKPLALNRDGGLKTGDPLFIIGHPVGLPLKVADNAVVRDAGEGKLYFMTDLDSYGGNSGSAVFNARTNKIEGILVRGAQDFRANEAKTCVESNRVAQNHGKGEGVTKINEEILAVIDRPDWYKTGKVIPLVDMDLNTASGLLNVQAPAFE